MKTKTTLAMIGLSVVLGYGCSSQPVTEEKPAVEDRTPVPSKPAAPPAAQTRPGTGSGDVSSKPIPPDASAGAGQATTGQNPLKDPNNILSKRSVFFDYDSDAIKEEFRPILQAHAKYLSSNRAARMLIQGSADDRGSREYNISLGQRRADAVKRMLVLLGAQDVQVEAASLGEEKPRCEDKTEACYAQNRRGDILYGGEY
jgi:peptidoglycan-associated lipoprotein